MVWLWEGREGRGLRGSLEAVERWGCWPKEARGCLARLLGEKAFRREGDLDWLKGSRLGYTVMRRGEAGWWRGAGLGDLQMGGFENRNWDWLFFNSGSGSLQEVDRAR